MDIPLAAEFNALAYLYFSPAAAGLTLIYLIWCFWRKWYAAFGVALICWWGLGYAGIGPVHYSHVLYVFSLVVLIRLGWSRLRCGPRLATRPQRIPLFAKLLFGLLAVIWAKSGVDTLRLGLDEFRKEAYYSLVFFALPGAVLMAAAFLVQPWRMVVRQMLVSGMVIGGIYFLFGVIGEAAHQPATLFFQGASRMTLHNIDTINAVRFAPFLMLGLLYLVLLRPSPQRITIVALGFCVLLLVLMLVGTRQIAVSVLVVAACSLPVMRRRLITVCLLVLAVSMALFTTYSNWMESTPLVERATIAREAGDGRLGIWRDAYTFTMEKPLFGGGFRTFGEFTFSVNPATGEVSFGRTNAHGLFQDAFTDHGLVLGGLLLLVSISVMVHGFLLSCRSNLPEAKAAGLVPIALWSSLFFSGALYGAWGFYFGLVVYAAVAAGLRSEGATRLAQTKARGWTVRPCLVRNLRA